ncbi:MAG TPA: hypothetical protein VIG24_07600 [Acidimicrobiia bacterium]
MLSKNTVKAVRREGRWVSVVLDSLGREQGAYPNVADAVTHAESICRYGWPRSADYAVHSGDGSCRADHLAGPSRFAADA